MIIKLSPICWDQEIVVAKSGDSLTINGQVLDFSAVAEGDSLPQASINCDFIVGDVRRIGGELEMRLLLPHAEDAADAVRFPADIVNPPDGPLELPR